MKTMAKITVGEKWPGAFPLGESMTPIIDGDSLSFLFWMGGLKESEEKAFLGEMQYGLFRDKAIPYILFGMRGLGTFDCFINMLAEQKETVDTFLAGEPDANLWTLYLVDGRKGGIVRGIRVIGVEQNIMHDIKEECFRQAEVYGSSAALISTANGVLNAYTAQALMKRAIMVKLRAAQG
jgi:hypothetical protein